MIRFKTVASYTDLPLAELAKAKLESEGIECHLQNKFHIGMNWLYSQALGGVKVQVREEQAEIAKNILERDESSYLENRNVSFPDIAESDICRACGSSNLELIKYSRFSAALILLTSVPFLFWGKRYRCKDCGHTMK